MRENKINKSGIVLEALGGGRFKIELEDSNEIIAYLSGKIRLHKIKILPGDKVTVETNPYDEGKGRIIYRKQIGSVN